LNWSAPGDDSNAGIAASYDLRFSTVKLSAANWDAATQVIGESAPLVAGSFESFTATGLLCQTTYYFGIKTLDELNNSSVLSNIAKGKTDRCIKLQVNPTTMPTGEVGVRYNSGMFDITGGAAPYDVQIDPTTLPPGILYGSQAFTGTPSEAKTYKIAAVVTDKVGSTANVKFKLKVAKPVVITTTSLRAGKVNATYRAPLKAKDGVKAYSWSLAPASPALPGTLVLDPGTGTITGVVNTAVSLDVNIRVTDALGGIDTQTLTLTFN
jgi:hypothetical protein